MGPFLRRAVGKEDPTLALPENGEGTKNPCRASTMAAKDSKSDDIASRDGDADARTQPVILEIVPQVPPEVPVATSVSFKVRVSCAAGSDLRGGHVDIMAAEQVVATPALADHRDGFNETAAIAIRSPDRVGAFDLTVAFPCQEIGANVYEETTVPIAFRTCPHTTSLAVWAVPSPVAIGGNFSVMVGAKSSGACELKGARVEISDETGAAVGHGTLGAAPWPGTSGLYWAQIGLAAPRGEGTFSWRVAFPVQELKLPHDASSATFGFTATRPPEHRLTVKVTESGGITPVADVEVALGPYRASTDAAGVARLEIPAGQFGLAVWKSGFEGAPKTVEIAGDVALQVEMTRVPQESEAWETAWD